MDTDLKAGWKTPLLPYSADERAPEDQGDRMFPIQDGPDIPWRCIAPYETQALYNHSQNLETLAQRQGLGCAEAVAVLEMRQWCILELGLARKRLAELVGNSPEVLRAQLDKAKDLLTTLARDEMIYRHNNDLYGGDDIRTGGSWDHMRRSGDRARKFLTEPQDGSPA